MLEAIQSRIAGAQTRLRAALVGSADTTPHRAALDALQAEFERQRQQLAGQLRQSEADRQALIERHAATLAQQARERIRQSIPAIPTCPQ